MTRSFVLFAAAMIILAAAERSHTQTALPRLEVDGQFFRQDTGARWTGIEASDFNLFNRFLAGENITPILRQRADAGFNLLRVWTDFDVCADGKCPERQPIGRLIPREHADYYKRLPDFLDLCAQHGLYVELTAFTGRPELDAAKIAHWDRLIEAVRPHTNVLLELINEHDAHDKSLPYDKLPRPPAPIPASHGSGGAGSPPKLPIWTYVTYHPGFGADWMRKIIQEGTQTAEKFGAPVLVNEATRFPDRDKSVEHAYDVGRGCALALAGCAFHSVSGKNSRLWNGHELDLARAFASGARSVALECQRGRLRELDDHRFLGVFARGDNNDCRVNIRR